MCYSRFRFFSFKFRAFHFWATPVTLKFESFLTASKKKKFCPISTHNAGSMNKAHCWSEPQRTKIERNICGQRSYNFRRYESSFANFDIRPKLHFYREKFSKSPRLQLVWQSGKQEGEKTKQIPKTRIVSGGISLIR